MEITEIKVFLVDEPKLKAFVSIVFDRCFMVNDIKVICGRDGLFVSMPSRRKKNGEFKDVAHPLNNETRSWMEGLILQEYQRTLGEHAGAEEAEVLIRPLPATSADGSSTNGGSDSSAANGPKPKSQSEPARDAAEPAADDDTGTRLEDVRRRHLSDSYWSVS